MRTILVSGNADGTVTHFHGVSGKTINRIVEEDNHILTVDYICDGTKIYDENKQIPISVFSKATWQNPGHTNRIFSVKFLKGADDKKNENKSKEDKESEELVIEKQENLFFSSNYQTNTDHLLISGGWDSNVHIWDLRISKSIANFYGPNLSGEALDFLQGVILTGSHRNKEQLQLWDFNTRQMVKNIDWEFGYPVENAYVYSCKFTRKGASQNIIAATAKKNEVKVFNSNKNYQTSCKVFNVKKGIFSVDIANLKNSFCFGGNDGIVYIVDIV